MEVAFHPGPGQRFLESLDPNGSGLSAHRLSSASAASTWQSEHVPDGHDAQAVCEQERRTLTHRTRTRSAKSRLCADDVPHDEQVAAIAPINKAKSKHKKLCRQIVELRRTIFAERAANAYLIRKKSELCK
jgi:hypothetical protein